MTTQAKNKIRVLREMKGYSQDFMAEKLNISQKQYSRIESGNAKLDVDRLKQISEVLEIDPSILLNDDTVTFNNFKKSNNLANNFGNIYISSEKYIEHLTEENKYLKEQNERLMKILESKM